MAPAKTFSCRPTQDLAVRPRNNLWMPGRTGNPGADFARQLERVALTATLGTQLSAVQGQLAAARDSSRAGWQRTQRRVLIAKRITMGGALVVAFLQYYLLDITVQIMAMPTVAFSTAHPLKQYPNKVQAKPARFADVAHGSDSDSNPGRA